MNTRFVWDSTKAKTNQRKHGITFEDAVQVFRDPLHLTVQDRIENGEYRWQTIGQINGATLLLVAHTITEDGMVETVRIISARPATPRERKLYANG